jgi:type VII secretion protein EccB
MARFRVVSKHQVSGWRFLLNRIEHALVRRDASMVDDPGRGRSMALLVGVALACVCVAGAAVLGFFKPAKVVGDSKIVADQDTGALYVNLSGRLFPALNLTSARLIAGSPDRPVRVPPEELANYPRGPWVGIPGAPGRMVGTTDRDSDWAACDSAQTGKAGPLDPSTGLPSAALSPVRTTAIGGPLTIDGDSVRELAADEARLVRRDGADWLVYRSENNGIVRATIDLKETPVVLALGIDTTAPVMPVSEGLLNAIPEAPALTVPQIPGDGSEVTLTSGGTARIGAVQTVASPGRPASYYLVTQQGLVQVSPVLAAMIRNADVQGTAASATVSPSVAAANLRPNARPVAPTFPTSPVELVDPAANPTTCFTWAREGDESIARTTILVGKQLPLARDEQARVVYLASASPTDARDADEVYLPTTTGRFVQVTGTEPGSRLQESLWWISDSGVRYGIDVPPGDSGPDQTLAALGIGSPVPAPWSIVKLFAPGPTLSQRDAKVQHDGIAPGNVVAPLPEQR